MGFFSTWQVGCSQIGKFFEDTTRSIGASFADFGKMFADNFGNVWFNVASTYRLSFQNFGKGNVTGGVAKFFEVTAGSAGNIITLGGANYIGNAVKNTDQVKVSACVDSDIGVLQFATKTSGLLGVLSDMGAAVTNDQIEQDTYAENGQIVQANLSGFKTSGKDVVAVLPQRLLFMVVQYWFMLLAKARQVLKPLRTYGRICACDELVNWGKLADNFVIMIFGLFDFNIMFERIG